jgi:hypothetical protein
LERYVVASQPVINRNTKPTKAVALAKSSDVIILAVGANWNSDGESGDRATLELSPNQSTFHIEPRV